MYGKRISVNLRQSKKVRIINLNRLKMKRKVFLSVCLLAICWGVCHAQDVIVTRDAKKISAKVMEINPGDVKYKNFDNPDGPTYTLPKSQIASILYQNGTVETFEAEIEKQTTQPATPPPSATSTPVTTPAATQNTRTTQPYMQPENILTQMRRDNPILYQQYQSAGRTRRTGSFLLISGGIVMAGGLIAVGSGEVDNVIGLGAAATVVGGICMTAGIPITIIGSARKGRALQTYERSIYGEVQPDALPRFQLNLHGNGLGLAYVF
jgi:hypothetical protein